MRTFILPLSKNKYPWISPSQGYVPLDQPYPRIRTLRLALSKITKPLLIIINYIMYIYWHLDVILTLPNFGKAPNFLLDRVLGFSKRKNKQRTNNWGEYYSVQVKVSTKKTHKIIFEGGGKFGSVLEMTIQTPSIKTVQNFSPKQKRYRIFFKTLFFCFFFVKITFFTLFKVSKIKNFGNFYISFFSPKFKKLNISLIYEAIIVIFSVSQK